MAEDSSSPQPSPDYNVDQDISAAVEPAELEQQKKAFEELDTEHTGTIPTANIGALLGIGAKGSEESNELIREVEGTVGESITFNNYIKLFANFKISG
jgi:Ca2+-binding EF-hand superfamily protein